MRFNIFVLLFSILTIASCNSPENTKAMEEAFEAKISFFLGNDENDGSKIDFTNTLILSPTYQFNQLKCDELCMNLLYSGQAQQVGILNSYRNNILFLEGDINKDVFDLNIFNYSHDLRVYHIEKMEFLLVNTKHRYAVKKKKFQKIDCQSIRVKAPLIR